VNELLIKGKKYISSKRASELTGYAKDYIGQLVRMGKLPAQRVGRSWYVEEGSLLIHSRSNQTNSNTEKAISTDAFRKSLTLLQGEEYSLPKTWSSISYLTDISDLFPSLKEKSPSSDILEEKENFRVPTRVVRQHDLRVTHSFNNYINSNNQYESRLDEKHTTKAIYLRKRKQKTSKSMMISGAIFVSVSLFCLALSGIFLPLEIKTGSSNTATALLSSKYAKELSGASFGAFREAFSRFLSVKK